MCLLARNVGNHVQFLYHHGAGDSLLTLEGEPFHYLYKVRRTRAKEHIMLRNLKNHERYTYELVDISRKEARLKLLFKEDKPVIPARFIHLLWAIVEPKIIEKTLPALNELGVGKITFFYARYSQRDLRLDMERLERIFIHSCEQCGRSMPPNLELLNSFKEAYQMYPASAMLDFGGEVLQDGACECIMIGPEGGFSEEERACGAQKFSAGNLILRSESAAMFALARLM